MLGRNYYAEGGGRNRIRTRDLQPTTRTQQLLVTTTLPGVYINLSNTEIISVHTVKVLKDIYISISDDKKYAMVTDWWVTTLGTVRHR